MKLTLSWLKEYINVPYKINVVCDHLTMGGVEVDSYEKIDNDYLIDIDLTPNRSDCLSVRGIARELSCLGYKYKLKNKPKIKPLKKTSLKNNPYVKISSKKSCPKFAIHRIRHPFTCLFTMQMQSDGTEQPIMQHIPAHRRQFFRSSATRDAHTCAQAAGGRLPSYAEARPGHVA